MCEEQTTMTPSQELAGQAADMLRQADLVREQDLNELRTALGIGSATAEKWLLWVDLATEEDDGDD